MVHLLTPSLVGDAGSDGYRVPAPAKCAELGLWRGQFGENCSHGYRCE
jgi:hypothetical protein